MSFVQRSNLKRADLEQLSKNLTSNSALAGPLKEIALEIRKAYTLPSPDAETIANLLSDSGLSAEVIKVIRLSLTSRSDAVASLFPKIWASDSPQYRLVSENEIETSTSVRLLRERGKFTVNIIGTAAVVRKKRDLLIRYVRRLNEASLTRGLCVGVLFSDMSHRQFDKDNVLMRRDTYTLELVPDMFTRISAFTEYMDANPIIVSRRGFTVESMSTEQINVRCISKFVSTGNTSDLANSDLYTFVPFVRQNQSPTLRRHTDEVSPDQEGFDSLIDEYLAYANQDVKFYSITGSASITRKAALAAMAPEILKVVKTLTLRFHNDDPDYLGELE